MGHERAVSCSACQNLAACGKYIPASFQEYHLVRLARECRNPRQASRAGRVAVAGGSRAMDRWEAEELVMRGLARWSPEGVLVLAGEDRELRPGAGWTRHRAEGSGGAGSPVAAGGGVL